MKPLIVVLSVLLVVLTTSLTHASPVAPQAVAEGCENPLELPGDKVLRISTSEVEFEHHGRLPIIPEVEAYHHWGEDIWPVPLGAVLVGFEDVVATIYQGAVIRFDVYDPLFIRTMRVALSTDQFRGIEHETLLLKPTSRLFVEEKGTGRGFMLDASGEVSVTVQDGAFYILDQKGTLWEFGQRLYVWPDPGEMIQVRSFKRGAGNQFYPTYRGRFELSVAGENSFLAINEIALEEYLYQVVPSEMPFSWPLEALKAQAVAARTYAVAQVIYSRQGARGFHVTDSTNSQVYNNQPEAAPTTRAIRETAGQILVKEDETISSTYYYSTSPGRVLDSKQAWQDTSALALEGNSPWFRWRTTFSTSELAALLKPLFSHDLGEVKGLEVAIRDSLGRVTSLRVVGTKGEGTINGELSIRSALRPSSLRRLNDTLGRQSLLPSALFFLEDERDNQGKLQSVTLYGGGSGHNLGMSQWGAKGMAEADYDYVSILSKYYSEAHLITHSEQLRY